jgi:hypothetical protein
MRVLTVRVHDRCGIRHATLVPVVVASLGLLAAACARQVPEPTSSNPVESRLTGRWTLLKTPISYHFWGDSAEILMYPPQAPTPGFYRVKGDSVQITNGRNVTTHAFAIRGETLFFAVVAAGSSTRSIRIAGNAANGIQGSWRSRSPTSVTVLTFRSDSALIMEVGVPPWPQRSNDTLSVRFETRVVRTAFHHANGRLIARGLDDGQYRSQTFVRRPWGCFGIAELDKKAKECN